MIVHVAQGEADGDGPVGVVDDVGHLAVHLEERRDHLHLMVSSVGARGIGPQARKFAMYWTRRRCRVPARGTAHRSGTAYNLPASCKVHHPTPAPPYSLWVSRESDPRSSVLTATLHSCEIRPISTTTLR